MAYAQVADVLGRAGRLSPTWDDETHPGLADIERFLDDVAGEIDALIASKGHALPLSNATAIGALRGLNADGALVLALRGSFPSEAVSEFLKATEARYTAAMNALKDGTQAALVLLNATDANAPGADDFWSRNPDYRVGLTWEQVRALNPYLQPWIEVGDRF